MKNKSQAEDEPKPKKAVGRGSMNYRMKKALQCKDGEIATKFPDKLKKLKRELMLRLPDQPYDGKKTSNLKLVQATAEHLLGEAQSTAEDKYGLSRGTVREALQMFFESREAREQALENILLDNAVTSGMVFKEKAGDLSARDAALVTGVFTQRYTELRRARQTNHAPEIPVNIVVMMEATLQRANEMKKAKARELSEGEE